MFPALKGNAVKDFGVGKSGVSLVVGVWESGRIRWGLVVGVASERNLVMARKHNGVAHQRRQAKTEKGQIQRTAKREARRKTHGQECRKLLEWLFPKTGSDFAGLKRHGNATWSFRSLVFLALCWAWAANRGVVDAFIYGSESCRALTPGPLPGSYQGLMNVLERWTVPLMKVMWQAVHQRMRQVDGGFWKLGGWVPIAFDGSRDSAPRTVSNEAAYCAPNHGKGKTAQSRKKKTKGMRRTQNERNKPAPPQPQVWITLLWHMGLRLPWTWRLGPSNASERADVMDMLEHEDFPPNTLFCGDAGFIGYPLWSAIRARGHHFLVRVGANASLLVERGLAVPKGPRTVLSWPQHAMQAGQPPLTLRLVKVRIGKTRMWLLTSVLDEAQLSLATIRDLYEKRWGIEVEFRGLQHTLNKGELRCRTAARISVELHWSLMAMTVAELFALQEQLPPPRAQKSSPPFNPQQRSLAQTMRALRWSLTHLPAFRACAPPRAKF